MDTAINMLRFCNRTEKEFGHMSAADKRSTISSYISDNKHGTVKVDLRDFDLCPKEKKLAVTAAAYGALLDKLEEMRKKYIAIDNNWRFLHPFVNYNNRKLAEIDAAIMLLKVMISGVPLEEDELSLVARKADNLKKERIKFVFNCFIGISLYAEMIFIFALAFARFLAFWG